MSQNVLLLATPNRIEDATLTGGSWLSALPRTNLATQPYTQVARSTNATTAYTQFDADLASTRSLRVIALSNHNISQAATWRITLGTSSGGAQVYDSGWINVWQMTFDNELLEWESPSWWAGTADDEYTGHPFAAIHALADWYSARYVRVEIDDTANVDGYVQIGRAHICNAFEPAVNASVGLKEGWRDLSTATSAESGAMWFSARRRLRNVMFVLDSLSQTEGDTLHNLQRSAGTIGEVFYVPRPSDAGMCQRYGFSGRLTEMSPLDYVQYNRRGLPVALEEIV